MNTIFKIVIRYLMLTMMNRMEDLEKECEQYLGTDVNESVEHQEVLRLTTTLKLRHTVTQRAEPNLLGFIN